ncbi:MAG: hypothetical protein O3C21_15785 [Verrucomicrobia bacterium]|nr:hypothetical protein [Verrucomicrobiota bacterium]
MESIEIGAIGVESATDLIVSEFQAFIRPVKAQRMVAALGMVFIQSVSRSALASCPLEVSSAFHIGVSNCQNYPVFRLPLVRHST